MEPRSGFATRGGLGEEAGGWVGIMLIINIVIPEEDFHGVRAISTTQARSSLQQEGSASSLYMFPSHTITAIDLLMGSLQPLDTFSCNFHTHTPPPRPKHALSPIQAQCFLFNLTQGSAIIRWVSISRLCLRKVKEKSQLLYIYHLKTSSS